MPQRYLARYTAAKALHVRWFQAYDFPTFLHLSSCSGLSHPASSRIAIRPRSLPKAKLVFHE